MYAMNSCPLPPKETANSNKQPKLGHAISPKRRPKPFLHGQHWTPVGVDNCHGPEGDSCHGPGVHKLLSLLQLSDIDIHLAQRPLFSGCSPETSSVLQGTPSACKTFRLATHHSYATMDITSQKAHSMSTKPIVLQHRSHEP